MNAATYLNKLFSIMTTMAVTDREGRPIEFNEAVEMVIDKIKKTSGAGNKLLFVGNGGSAAIASHEAIDFSKNGKIRSMCFNEAALLTCLGNDYGYECVFEKSLEIFADPKDVLIAISSSGRSSNILKAVTAARNMNCGVITLSGFNEDNPLRGGGDFNFFVKSKSYGFVELSHQVILHLIIDLITKEWEKDK